MNCRLPWVGMAFSEKQWSPCVSYDWLWENWDDFDINHPKFCELRKNIYNNTLSDMPICTRCTRNKDKAGYFDDKMFDEIYEHNMKNYDPITGRIENYKLGFIEYLYTTNCNLSCRMCGNNSSLYHEKLGNVSKKIFNVQQKDFVDNSDCFRFKDMIDKNKNTLINVALLGGEIFFEKKSTEIFNIIPENVSIFLFTNGMIYRDEIVDKISKHENNQLVFSIDNIGKVNDYIRIGSKYDVIINNAKKCAEKMKGKMVMHSAISVYSALYLDDLINGILNMDGLFDIHCFTIANNPPEISVRYTHVDIKNYILERIMYWKTYLITNEDNIDVNIFININECLDGLLNELVLCDYDEDIYNRFLLYTKETNDVFNFNNIFLDKINEITNKEV